MNKTQLTKLIKDKAIALDFEQIGISKAGFLEEEAPRLEDWLNKKHQGKMSYMENYFDLRLDPTKLVEGSKSVISLVLNYYPEDILVGDVSIAKYAYGKDYHKVIKKKVNALLIDLKTEIGDFNARAFTDSAPIMERQWAAKSGLGWLGKNTLLINKRKGSFYFLAEIICDLELDYDVPVNDHCGTCTACLDACPTDALLKPYELDASKCISYLTIELKDNLPSEFKGKFGNWAFGCDICQDVCPWNRKSKPNTTLEFQPNDAFKEAYQNDFKEITIEAFDKVFSGSAVKRTKYEGFVRNLDFLS